MSHADGQNDATAENRGSHRFGSAVTGLTALLLFVGIAIGPGMALLLKAAGSPARGVVTASERLPAYDLRYALEGRRGSRPNAIATVAFTDRRGIERVGRLPFRWSGCAGVACPNPPGRDVAIRYFPFFWTDRVVVSKHGSTESFDRGWWESLGWVAFAAVVAVTLHACGVRRQNKWRMLVEAFGGRRR
ncbi:MAG: hypothetical protein AAF532_16500 [Planctomycetota bacterium]